MKSLIVLLAVVTPARCQDLLEHIPRGWSERANPLEGNERARQAGAKLFARECAACHGVNREGHGKAPPLDRVSVYQARPGALFWVLRSGSLHKGMPSFAHLPETQRWQIVEFLRRTTGCASP